MAAPTLNAQLQGALEHLAPSAAYAQVRAPPPMFAAPQPRFAQQPQVQAVSHSRLTDSVYGDPANGLQQLFTVTSGVSVKNPGKTRTAPPPKPKKSYWWIFGIVIIVLVIVGVIVVVVTRSMAKKQQAKDLAELQRIEGEKAAAVKDAEAAEAAASAAADLARAKQEAEIAVARAAQHAQAQAAAAARARVAAAAAAQPTIILATQQQQQSTQPHPILKTSPRVEMMPDDAPPVDHGSTQVDTIQAVNARISEGVEELTQGISAAGSAEPAAATAL